MKHGFFAGMLAVLALLCTPALAESAPKKEAKLAGKTVPMQVEIRGELMDREMNLFFLEGSEIPYVSVREYMPFLSNMMSDTPFGENISDAPSFEVKLEDGSAMVTRSDSSPHFCQVSPEEDCVAFSDYNAFLIKPGHRALVTVLDLPDPGEEIDPVALYDAMTAAMQSGPDPQTDGQDGSDAEGKTQEIPGEGPRKVLFATNSNYYNRNGIILVMDLKSYGIDIVSDADEVYMPLQTASDIFMPSLNLHCIYNGEKILVVPFRSENLKYAYSVEPGSLSEEMASFNYRELLFLLDYFYGLKEEHNIDNFRTLLEDYTGLSTQMQDTDPRKVDVALTTMISLYCDDLHSGVILPSYRSGMEAADLLSVAGMINYGTSEQKYDLLWEIFTSARRATFRAWVPGYEEIGDTAFITFDTFTSYRNPEDYYTGEPILDPRDTIELILYADQQIRRENSPVKNVVIDLSCNEGGDITAAIFAISWYLGRSNIAIVDTLSRAQTNMTYFADVNLNGVFREKEDCLAGDYHLYCLTSPLSFSCGNLVPAAFKASGRVTLLGQTTGGGACCVLPCTSAIGSVFQISGNKMLSTMKNGSLYNMDLGVEPDVTLTKAESFYNRPALVDMIHEMK